MKCATCGKGILAGDRSSGRCRRCGCYLNVQPQNLDLMTADAREAFVTGNPMITATMPHFNCLHCNAGDHDKCDADHMRFCQCRLEGHEEEF